MMHRSFGCLSYVVGCFVRLAGAHGVENCARGRLEGVSERLVLRRSARHWILKIGAAAWVVAVGVGLWVCTIDYVAVWCQCLSLWRWRGCCDLLTSRGVRSGKDSILAIVMDMK